MTGRELIDRIIKIVNQQIVEADDCCIATLIETKAIIGSMAMSNTNTNMNWWVEYKNSKLKIGSSISLVAKCIFGFEDDREYKVCVVDMGIMYQQGLMLLVRQDIGNASWHKAFDGLDYPDQDRPILHFEPCGCGGNDDTL